MYGVVSLPCDGGPSGSYLAIQANGIAYIGWSNTPANGVLWTQVFTAKNPPTAADINAADVRNNFAARMGVSRVLTGNNAPTSAGVWSVENSSGQARHGVHSFVRRTAAIYRRHQATRSFYITCKLRMRLVARRVCAPLLTLTGRSAGGIR